MAIPLELDLEDNKNKRNSKLSQIKSHRNKRRFSQNTVRQLPTTRSLSSQIFSLHNSFLQQFVSELYSLYLQLQHGSIDIPLTSIRNPSTDDNESQISSSNNICFPVLDSHNISQVPDTNETLDSEVENENESSNEMSSTNQTWKYFAQVGHDLRMIADSFEKSHVGDFCNNQPAKQSKSLNYCIKFDNEKKKVGLFSKIQFGIIGTGSILMLTFGFSKFVR